jgi:hypothetical protein
MCTVANTTAILFAYSFKVHWIEIWAPNDGATGNATVADFNWANLDATQNTGYQITALTATTPGHYRGKPPKNSACNVPQGAAGENMIQFNNIPQGTVIDVHITHLLRDNASVGTSQAVGTMALGVIGWGGLDGAVPTAVVPVNRSPFT